MRRSKGRGRPRRTDDELSRIWPADKLISDRAKYFHYERDEPLKRSVQRAVQEAYEIWCAVSLYVDHTETLEERRQRSLELRRKKLLNPVWLKRRQRRLDKAKKNRQWVKDFRPTSSYVKLSDENEAQIALPPISKPEIDGNLDSTVQRILQRLRRGERKKKL